MSVHYNKEGKITPRKLLIPAIAVLILAVAMVLGTFAPRTVLADGMPELYFIDAHSQLPSGFAPSKIIPLMDKAGVWHTILSARNDRSPKDVANYAAKHPDRITAAVRSKGKSFNKNKPKFEELINLQLKQPIFKALGEVILYHAQKGNKAPEINVSLHSPQARMLLDVALERKWPFIAHYELRASGPAKSKILNSFKATARANPDHPFLLIHMAQLNVDEVKRLIAAHGNVYFLTSHSNPIRDFSMRQPWTNLFDGERLLPRWTEVFLKNPNRFVLAFDNVWPENWDYQYLGQAALWRKALAKLPPGAAHAIGHGNAERLWNLTPR